MGIKKYFILTEVKDLHDIILKYLQSSLRNVSSVSDDKCQMESKKKNIEDVADLKINSIVTMHPNPHQSIPAKQKTHKLQVAAWRRAFEEQI